jgi:hypothetical protein
MDEANECMAHRAGGGRVVFVRNNHIMLAQGGEEMPLLGLARSSRHRGAAGACWPHWPAGRWTCRRPDLRRPARFRPGRRKEQIKIRARHDRADPARPKGKFMEVSRVRALRGPNLWSHHTSIEAIVACTPDEESIGALPGFETRLRALFPEIWPAAADFGHDDTIPLAQVLEVAALALQAASRLPRHLQPHHRHLERGIYQVVVEYSEEDVGRLAMQLAEQLIAAARNDQPFDLEGALTQLRDLDEDVRLGPSTGSIVHAAVARGIPFRRLTEGSLVQFGWGSRQRRIQAAEIDATGAIAEPSPRTRN